MDITIICAVCRNKNVRFKSVCNFGKEFQIRRFEKNIKEQGWHILQLSEKPSMCFQTKLYICPDCNKDLLEKIASTNIRPFSCSYSTK